MLFTLFRCGYSLVFTLMLPGILLRMLWRSLRAPLYRNRWLERFGLFSPLPEHIGCLWVHAVSVGEVVSSIPLIRAFQAKYPNIPITVTTTTPTGSEQVKRSLGNDVFHVYIPYDLPWSLRNFFKRTQPKWLVIMETELWPNLLNLCKKKEVPVIVANGRLSEQSICGYKKLGGIMRKILSQVTCVAAQSSLDGERFVELGLPEDKLYVTGNLKFDTKILVKHEEFGQKLKQGFGERLTWVAASTHPGEHEKVLCALTKVREDYPDSLLMIVPRHPEQFNVVAQLLEDQDISYVRRSDNQPVTTKTNVLLGDTMGELPVYYQAADVAFVGGSLLPIGGHNLLEPAAMKCPIISGTYVDNFIEISKKLSSASAIYFVKTSMQLSNAITRLFLDKEKRIFMGKKAHNVVRENQGAIAQVMILLDKYIC